ncbi:Methyltransferase domain-containing protein [Halomicrobium zhouii]|uniref:Methyltransferase domain-containing protein n=2 Tax=Halomicrobium zhouii TaxID=767519 RepID=A0A1I6L760_9EURY|nr:Methyltransferase domain-containing protein [Halomicrobium zhouii]
MRQFSADYLETTREGMWEGSREALTDLDLAERESVLDVGCGTGVLTRVLREECPGEVVGLDADPALLQAVDPPVVRGDATRLPFREDAVDLVVCQALLINLPDPSVAVREFARVAADAVAVVEPDNSAVTVESTVDDEPALARRARERYLDGVDTDVALGASAAALLDDAGLDVVSTRRYDQVRRTGPPYSESAIEAARRKATGEALADNRAEILAGDASEADYDALRREWRSLGRDVVEQMQNEAYERTETVPFFVTVGRV